MVRARVLRYVSLGAAGMVAPGDIIMVDAREWAHLFENGTLELDKEEKVEIETKEEDTGTRRRRRADG